jgi:hypothetical protein
MSVTIQKLCAQASRRVVHRCQAGVAGARRLDRAPVLLMTIRVADPCVEREQLCEGYE